MRCLISIYLPYQMRKKQLTLALKERFGWGGRRDGAGRKPVGRVAGVPHRERPVLEKEKPLHVTLRTVRELGNVRRKRYFFAIRDAFKEGRERFGFRLVHYSVQHDHIHMIVEANHRKALTRGMQGLM